MALRDVLVAFNVDVTGRKELDEVDTSLSKVLEKADLLAKAFVGLTIVRGVTSFIGDVVEMGAKISDTANRLGVGTDELQEFEYGAKLVGVSADTAARSLQFLERNLGNAANGMTATNKTFAQLGIQTQDATGHTKNMGEILPEIADKFAQLGDQQKEAAFATKVFGRSGMAMIPILREGREGLKRVHKEWEALGGGLHGDALTALKDVDRAFTKWGVSLNMMKSRIVLGLKPAIDWFIDAGIKVVGFLGQMADKTYGAQTALIALGVIAAAAFAPMLIAIAPVILAVGVLYLAFDELYTLFQGGDTLIGRFIDNLFGTGTAQEWVKEMKEAFSEFKDSLKEDIIPWLKELKDILGSVWEVGKGPLKNYMLLIKDLIQDLWRLTEASIKLSLGDLSGAYDAFAKVGEHWEDAQKSKRKTEDDIFQRRADKTVATLLNAPGSDVAGAHYDPSAGKSNYNQMHGKLPDAVAAYAAGMRIDDKINLPTIVINNHINGAGDPDAVASGITKHAASDISESLRKTHGQIKANRGNPQPPTKVGTGTR